MPPHFHSDHHFFKSLCQYQQLSKISKFYHFSLRCTEILPRTRQHTQTSFMSNNHRQREAPIRNNTPVILNSTQLSEALDPETITISFVASPEPQIVTINSDSNEPTFPFAFGTQHPIVPPSLNNLNLPPNTFNVLASMVVIRQDQEQSPQSPEPSDPSPISMRTMNLSTIDDWETTHTTTDNNTF